MYRKIIKFKINQGIILSQEKNSHHLNNPEFLNYFSLLETYHPEYFDDLPSEIMNHFRTSTVRPVYDDYSENDIEEQPVKCNYGEFISPCINPPSFSLSDLSKLSEDYSMSTGSIVREPTQMLPPTGRIPYPTFRPDHDYHVTGSHINITPLMDIPRKYIPSSTIRPPFKSFAAVNHTGTRERERSSLVILRNHGDDLITTYRPKFSLSETREKESSRELLMRRIKTRLTEIIQKIKDKEKAGVPPRNLYQQRRKNGQRYYPDNYINPHLPVTSASHPDLHQETEFNSNNTLNPNDYFTVKDRSINSATSMTLFNGSCWLLLTMIQTIMFL